MKTAGLLKRIFKLYLWIAAFFVSAFIVWAVSDAPLFLDRACTFSQSPVDAEYIVCVGGGLTIGNLPTDDGWGRIYTSVQLYLDGYGRKIVFTGGGSGGLSEAEVYAEAARWLGMAEEDALLDPGPNQTSEHPRNVQSIPGAGITPATPLDIVTSPLHSRRTALCFRKAGFSNFRLVTVYFATGQRTAVRMVPSEKAGEPPVFEEVVASRAGAAEFLRERKTSALPSYARSDKIYDDVFMRLRSGAWRLFTTLRELSALAVYKVKGYI